MSKGTDFAFATFRLKALIHMLDEQGYRLDESCRHSLHTATLAMYIKTGLGLAALILGIVAVVILPHTF